jgi:anti-sigma factor RsiW
MSTPACDQTLLLQAEFDGELDAAQSAALAAHRAACPACQQASADLALLRTRLKQEVSYHRAPERLRRALATMPAPETAKHPPATVTVLRTASWLRMAASFVTGAALAASVALFLAPQNSDLADAVASAHLRSLQPGHLEDVISTDQHTVKPWFDGKLDFAPPVKDLVAQGFPLQGGRLDYLDGRPVAAMVYGRAKHEINLFVWPEPGADSPPAITNYNGYNLVHWREGGMTLWAVSDVEKTQLEDFAALWRREP